MAGFFQNALLVAKREYMERIRTRAFVIATVLIPTLMGGGIFGVAKIASNAKSTAHIAVVSSTPEPAQDLKRALEHSPDSRMQVDLLPAQPDPRPELNKQIEQKKLDGYLVIDGDTVNGVRPNFDFTPQSSADIATKGAVTEALTRVLTFESLASHGFTPDQMRTVMAPVTVNTVEPGGHHADSKQAFYVAYTLFFLMYMVVLLYGMNVARSIIEEKTSRVFEVLLSTIRADELLAGKILGVGAVGLTQVAIWMAAAGIYAARAGMVSGIVISPMQIGFFIIYFLLGYTLYSAVAASLGAMVNSEQELQQLNMFLMLPLFFSMGMLPVLISNPNSLLAKVVSQIPFCAPLLMNFRISISTPAPWEIGLSIALIVITAAAVLWISSRIYRVGILMYGKKPNMAEIVRWMKYS